MGLTGFQLKLLAAALMVLDHLQYYVPGYPLWFRYLGRLSAPLFFFMAVEGFIHTRSRGRLIARLLAGALAMAAGSRALSAVMPYYKNLPNIFLSLATGLLILWSASWGEQTGRPALGRALAFLWGLVSMWTEASGYGVALVLCFYYLRDNKAGLVITYALVSVLPSLHSFTMGPDAWLVWDYQWMMAFAIPLMLFYNGQRGSSSAAAKWFFYVFYPVHIWILYAMGYAAFSRPFGG